MKKILFPALAAVSLFAALAGSDASAQTLSPATAITFVPQVAIECANPGSHQDVAKTPILKNTTGSVIPKGKILRWRSTDGDYGSVQLQSDLAPGAVVRGLGDAGNGYQCTASFSAGAPDLTIVSAKWTTATTVAVQVRNLNAFAGAAPSVVRVQSMSCSGLQLAAKDSAEIALAKGETKTVILSVPAWTGKSYLRVTADATKKVWESNEGNNVSEDMGSCVH
jgi:hypothetical protein